MYLTSNIGQGLLAYPDQFMSLLASIPLVLVFGDSNTVGEDSTDSSDPAFAAAVTQSTSFVHFDKHYALAAADPITYQTDITGGVQAYTVGGTPGMSFEISLGQTLTAAGLKSVLAVFGIFGVAVSQSIPASTYPTQPPAGPNVIAQVISRTHALEASLGAKTKVIVIHNGGNDGASGTDAANLAANSLTLANTLTTAFPGARIVWLKINADTVNASGVPNEATCITNQATFFSANPTIVPVYDDDCALLSDHAHLKSDSSLTIGQRVGREVLALLGIPVPRPTTFPAVIGFGPAPFSAGTNLSPHSPGNAKAGDLEILVQMSLTGSGVNNALTTPSGWTLIGTTSSASGGAINRVAFYQRAVDATMITTNKGNTAATTVLAANTNEFAAIFTIRGPNVTAPTVEASQISSNNTFGTSLAMTGVTTLGANRLVVIITAGFRTNATPNPITISGTNLSGVTVIRNGTRNSGLSNFGTIDVQTGTLAAAGPSGNPTATLALATIAIGCVLSIAP